MILRLFIVISILFLIEYYFYQAINTVIRDSSESKRQSIKYIYIGITVFFWMVGIAMLLYPIQKWNVYLRNYLGGIAVLSLLIKLIPGLILFVEDIYRVIIT